MIAANVGDVAATARHTGRTVARILFAPIVKDQEMPVNLENLLRQAATCIDPKKDKGAYAYMIGEEVADHIAQVRSGEIPLDAFAEHYGLIKQAYP